MTPRNNNNNNDTNDNKKPNGEIIRVAVVTGSSSGIGFETALKLARNGFYTYATSVILKNLGVSKR